MESSEIPSKRKSKSPPKEDLKSKLQAQEEVQKGEVSPTVWVPVSLLIAVIFAVANVCVSTISRHGSKGIALQGFGNLVGNLVPLVLVSNSNKKELDDNKKPAGSYLKWFYNIYFFRKMDSKGNYLENKWTGSVQWKRVVLSVILLVFSQIVTIVFIYSYKFAGQANFNTGVLMSVYSLKPAITSIVFFLAFKQTLKMHEMATLVLCMAGASIIGLSSEDDEKTGGQTIRTYLILAICFMLLDIIIGCLRSAILKYFFGSSPEIDISSLFNFIELFSDAIFIGYFMVLRSQRFEYTITDLIAGTISGTLFSCACNLVAFVNVRGKAGVCDAIIETSVIYQVVIEILVFSRFPNKMQYIGLFLCFSATLFLIYWSQIKKS
ncbi:unnamed protein product [Moneuplotes crassus]|uniref:Uncharacterized protein n=1 Tax=Euplotes crassus TaxID=5936 RepID=A0AAD1ULL8_EUPCR|nr:unnamed protein product [Moneuplotes crassus]